MMFMFAESGITQVDLSGFDTRYTMRPDDANWSVQFGFEGMFMNCKNLKMLDISNFQGTYYPGMFFGCESLKNIKLFESINYDEDGYYIPRNELSGLFYGCKNLKELDLSVLKDVKNPECLRYMFANCTKLKKIYVSSNWTYDYTHVYEIENLDGTIENKTIDNYHDHTDMFKNCPKLTGGKGTKWSAQNKTDHTFAHVDDGKERPGYFTIKK